MDLTAHNLFGTVEGLVAVGTLAKSRDSAHWGNLRRCTPRCRGPGGGGPLPSGR